MQKSYADMSRTHKEFKVGDHEFLRVKSKKISLKLWCCAKLAPRFCGSFEILERIGLVAYRIAFLDSIRAHIVFNVSLLRNVCHIPIV